MYTLVAFLVALAVLIVVHELGHYFAARLCGVKVLRFSIGFGRPLVAWRTGRDGTEWVIAAVPFGGYVRMLDEREGPVAPEERARAFNRQPLGRRSAIVAAGPALNFAFAIAVYTGLYLVGIPEARPVLGEPPPGTPAHAARLQAGDTVRAVDGSPVRTWQELRWHLVKASLERRAIELEIQAEGGGVARRMLDLSAQEALAPGADPLARAGLQLKRPALEPVLGAVASGSPAERAGLRVGDRIMHADGVSVAHWEELVRAVRAKPGVPLRLTVERDGVRMSLEVVPDSVDDAGVRIGRIGVAPKRVANDPLLVQVRHGPAEALWLAAAKTWDLSVFSLRMLWKMVSGELSWRHLSGPVTIADYAGQSAQLGWISYLTFLALVSVSLGVLNLLPIPILDGGHLMYHAIELVRGAPLSDRALEFGHRVGVAVLFVLMAFALYNDLQRLFGG